jgi:hypothetical protein
VVIVLGFSDEIRVKIIKSIDVHRWHNHLMFQDNKVEVALYKTQFSRGK